MLHTTKQIRFTSRTYKWTHKIGFCLPSAADHGGTTISAATRWSETSLMLSQAGFSIGSRVNILYPTGTTSRMKLKRYNHEMVAYIYCAVNELSD